MSFLSRLFASSDAGSVVDDSVEDPKSIYSVSGGKVVSEENGGSSRAVAAVQNGVHEAFVYELKMLCSGINDRSSAEKDRIKQRICSMFSENVLLDEIEVSLSLDKGVQALLRANAPDEFVLALQLISKYPSSVVQTQALRIVTILERCSRDRSIRLNGKGVIILIMLCASTHVCSAARESAHRILCIISSAKIPSFGVEPALGRYCGKTVWEAAEGQSLEIAIQLLESVTALLSAVFQVQPSSHIFAEFTSCGGRNALYSLLMAAEDRSSRERVLCTIRNFLHIGPPLDDSDDLSGIEMARNFSISLCSNCRDATSRIFKCFSLINIV